MAGSLNKVILIGNLGDEVKMHYFDDKNSIGRFPLATHETYTNRDGDRIKNTEWHNIVVRNKLAELCEKYLHKGDKVYVEGRLKTRQWEQDGIKRYQTEIHAHDMVFLSTRRDQQDNSGPSVANQSKVKPKEPDVNDDTVGDDDLPF